jgi:hypothetical protein
MFKLFKNQKLLKWQYDEIQILKSEKESLFNTVSNLEAKISAINDLVKKRETEKVKLQAELKTTKDKVREQTEADLIYAELKIIMSLFKKEELSYSDVKQRNIMQERLAALNAQRQQHYSTSQVPPSPLGILGQLAGNLFR